MSSLNRIIFSFLIVGCIFGATRVYAQEQLPLSSVIAEMASPGASANAIVHKKDSEELEQYILPYPGILADHPLYSIKKIRDVILEFLISDPVRKIEFYLLQSDKDVNASIFLSEKKAYPSMQRSLESALVYKKKAIDRMSDISTRPGALPEFIVSRSVLSLEKHMIVLQEMQNIESKDIQSFVVSHQSQLKSLLEKARSVNR